MLCELNVCRINKWRKRRGNGNCEFVNFERLLILRIYFQCFMVDELYESEDRKVFFQFESETSQLMFTFYTIHIIHIIRMYNVQSINITNYYLYTSLHIIIMTSLITNNTDYWLRANCHVIRAPIWAGAIKVNS